MIESIFSKLINLPVTCLSQNQNNWISTKIINIKKKLISASDNNNSPTTLFTLRLDFKTEILTIFDDNSNNNNFFSTFTYTASFNFRSSRPKLYSKVDVQKTLKNYQSNLRCGVLFKWSCRPWYSFKIYLNSCFCNLNLFGLKKSSPVIRSTYL